MNDATNVKQQIIEHIKQSANILVTVSRDSSVDELSAALGLTLMLNKLKKHATAVVSGAIPPAIQFLEPDKTFEGTVDSLRDFIIALDKEKADHLRYKVDGDVVKIFITPYRTTISDKDLQFSQGDYNVELVLALGVTNKEHLDKALESHGRILHDAVVVALSCGETTSELGSLNWHESSASSMSEMLVSLSEALKGSEPVLDEQVATAFLTGIVSATDRFSNNKTSSKVMTMAAQLMAAGANQQLIAAKLEEAHEISSDNATDTEDASPENNDGTTDLAEGASSKIDRQNKSKKSKKAAKAETPKEDGALAINHELEGTPEQVADQVQQERSAEAAEKAEDILASQLQSVAQETGGTVAAATPSVADLQKDLAAASAEVEEAATVDSAKKESVSNEIPKPDYEPTFGGVLNATTEQAALDKQHEAEQSRNRTILSHDSPSQPASNSTASTPPFTAAMQSDPDEQNIEPLMSAPEPAPGVAPAIEPIHETLADLDTKNRSSHGDAMAAVEAAYGSAPFNPANNPLEASGAQQLGEVPHDTAPAPASMPLPPPPSIAPPDFTALPPPPPPPMPGSPITPAEQLGQVFGDMPAVQSPASPVQPQAADPAQFKIPGQS